MDINVDATRGQDGSVTCAITCDGQSAKVIFTGTEVIFDVSEPRAGT